MFRRMRPCWMYLPRAPKKTEKDHPMQVQNARDFMRAIFLFSVLSFLGASLVSLRKLQKRERHSAAEVLRKRSGPRVVVIGGGAGGAATAAQLCSTTTDVHVTVIEKDRHQTFQGHVGLAHVGHRSYDLTTTTGIDPLRSPASWNVTRDASLMLAEVVRVDPAAQEVRVRTTPSMLAAAKPVGDDGGSGGGAALTKKTGATGVQQRGHTWWPGWLSRGSASSSSASTVVSLNEDGSYNLADGTTRVPYDVLVVAAGAERTVGSLRTHLTASQLDSYRIAVNPGTTRDSLTAIFLGNVLYVKVPPASFVQQMEAARAMLGKSTRGREASCASLRLPAEPREASAAAVGPAAPTAEEVASALRAPWSKLTPFEKLQVKFRDLRDGERLRKDSAADDAANPESLLSDEIAVRRSRTVGHSSTAATRANEEREQAATSPTSSWPLPLLAEWCMHFSSRQHDSTFVSSTNTITKYLMYFNKLSFCQLFAVTADAQPIGPAPREVNRVIENFWRERRRACRQGSGPEGDRLHILYHSYITAVDSVANTVTLYDYKNNAEVQIPYQLLVLDLPLRAPAFVRESGLHRRHYVEECVLPALAEGTRAVAAELTANSGTTELSAPAASAASATAMTSPSSPPAVSDGKTREDFATALRRHPLLGKSKKELEAVFADESSFMDVDPATLQHRRYPNVFAIGDVAGLPSIKSYSAAMAQVPVLVHNVQHFLHSQTQKAAAAAAAEETTESTSAPSFPAPPPLQIKYDGYSSFHVVMTTWKAMWPEMHSATPPRVCGDQKDVLEDTAAEPTAAPAELKAAAASSSISSASVSSSPSAPAASAAQRADLLARKARWDLVVPLRYCNHHMWDSLAWRDLRGVLNGVFTQSSLYEHMYFFAFMRGMWYPPTWMYVPTVLPDGKLSTPSLWGVL